MSILGTILERSKIKKGSRKKFFSIVTAETGLEGRTDLRRTEKAGLVFNPVESQFFENLDSEMRNLLAVSAGTTGTRYEIRDDGYGTRWVILDDRDFEDLVTTLHIIGEAFTDHGFGDRLIAAVFGLKYEGKKAYWIYYIKRGSFYPVVLSGEKTRDNAAEMRLSALMEEERVPVEKDIEKWYALWGIPF